MRLGSPILFCFLLLPSANAYSVLTHQAIIDTAWNDAIRPLLLKRYPSATPDELRKAHAYAYGGAIIQDLGYYPFGSHLFSDLVHYVRGGDFVEHLLAGARDLNEFAFALGALAHTAADREGHSIATNHAVASLYPKLKAKYGDPVAYEKNPAAHLKVEFGFDVSQVARGNYAPEAYHDFIGFEVSKPLLERAFRETYCIEFESLFLSVDLALGTYRRSVSSLIPRMTRVAWQSKRDEIQKLTPGVTRRKFIYNISRASYHKEWGNQYQQPGCGSRLLAWMFRLVPHVGPFRALEFKLLTPDAEKLFLESFNATLVRYRAMLPRAASGKLEVENVNFDTGKPVVAGEYGLADESYASLVDRLAKNNFTGVDPALKAEILKFYSNPQAPIATRKKPKEWEELQRNLRILQTSSR